MKKPVLRIILKVLFWSAAVLLTLTILFFSVENWRGARAWADTKAQLEEEGEVLDIAALRPGPVRPDVNFGAIPLLASLTDFSRSADGDEIEYRDPETRDRFLEMRLPEPSEDRNKPGDPNLGDSKGIDLRSWADFLTAAGNFDTGDAGAQPETQIRNAFARFDADFAEIGEAASNRPHAWFPVKHGNNFFENIAMPLPHLSELVEFSRFLTVKGSAAALQADTETAKECVQIQLRLAEGIGAEPILICHLVEITILDHAAAVIREGLLARTWSEADLEWFSGQLEAIDLYEHGANAMRGEMTGFFVAGAEDLKALNFMERRILGEALIGLTGSSLKNMGAMLIPDGWFDQNAAIGCDLIYRHGILPMKNRDFSGLAEDDPLQRELRLTTPYNFFAKIMVPATGTVVRRTVQCQTTLDSIRVACALERFHLQHQNYAESLDELVPELLKSVPEDPMTSGPLLFKQGENGYRIYSVGLNGKDEGGALFRKADGKVDRDKGDWLFSCERDGS